MHPTSPVTTHTHTFVSGLQTLGPLPAQSHRESEHSLFCDASGPECLLADPGQCHQLFSGNPSPHILFYSGNNAVNEEGLKGRGTGRRTEASWTVTRAWRIWRPGFRPWRLAKQPWTGYSTFWSLSYLTGERPAAIVQAVRIRQEKWK